MLFAFCVTVGVAGLIGPEYVADLPVEGRSLFAVLFSLCMVHQYLGKRE
jgi:hypothetical protein